MDRAKEMVEGVAGDVAETADREGLTAGHAKTLAENMVSGVKSVADRGIEAVFEDKRSQNSSTVQQPTKTWVNQ